MTVTFENDNDIILYALKRIISYARRTQQIFLAQCIWWLAGIIGLEGGLITYIDNLQAREVVANGEGSNLSRKDRGNSNNTPYPIHPHRAKQVSDTREVSGTPRDLLQDQRCDDILDSAEQCLEESSRARNQWQRNRVNRLPSTKKQLKKARKMKRLQEARNKEAATRRQRLQDI